MQAFIGDRFDINTRGPGGTTILHDAIFGGVELMMYLLQVEGVEKLVNARDSSGLMPLHWAMEADDYGFSDERWIMAVVLLEHGAAIHARGEEWNPPAHSVADLGVVDTMRVFTAAGIGFHAGGDSGETILHRAVLYGKKAMLEYLLGQEGGRGIIHARDKLGHKPLKYEVLLDKREMVERQVECGAKT